ncbi:uncharacterized protein BDFB_000796 [Asbolus verrucosus]|uniref:Uncharacterized protein n=1 Tax=Asbolus verrucosus TaxID=1661398 RepID=A0A482VEP1_ASBVE|nr:uncharacterized protein BDFB_000796 [Asbolus verrucosus]
MVVLDQFYQIIERNTVGVPIFWKVAHVIIFIAAAVSGFLATFAFGQVLQDFNYNCLLNADIVFNNNTQFPIWTRDGTKNVSEIDLTETVWGPATGCNFAQFTPLFTMISALIWGVFFIILAKGGAGYSTDLLSKPWHIVYPCIFYCAIAFITHLVSTLKLQNGIRQFCMEFKPELHNNQCVPEIDKYTDQQFYISKGNKIFSNFYLNQEVAIISSQVGAWMWIVQLCLLIARVCCVTDYDLHLVTIIPKEEMSGSKM